MNIPQCIYPFLMLMNFQMVLNYDFYERGPWTFIYTYFSEHIYIFLSHVYLRVEMLSHNIWIFRFLKMLAGFQGVCTVIRLLLTYESSLSFLYSKPLFLVMSLFLLISACTQDSVSDLQVFFCLSYNASKTYCNILLFEASSRSAVLVVNPVCLLICEQVHFPKHVSYSSL